MTTPEVADPLTGFRGVFPTQGLDARRIAGLLEAPGCHRRLVIDAASVNISVLAQLLECPPAGMSPHATLRGQRFERNVLDNAMAELVPLIRAHLGMPVRDIRQADLNRAQMRTQHPRLDSEGILRLRLAETRRQVQTMLDDDTSALNLVRHPLIPFELAGVTTYLEPDVLSYASGRSLTPVEVKSFPLQHKTYADPHKIGAAARQVAVYTLALRQLVSDCGASSSRVTDTALLVLTSGFSVRPDASVINLADHVSHLERVLRDYPKAGEVLSEVPRVVPLPEPPAPGASAAERRQARAQAKEAVSALPMRYGDGCASCPMLAFCADEAKRTDAVAQLGTHAANVCGDVTTMRTIFDIIGKRRRPVTGAERAVAHDFERAAQALALAGVHLEH